MIVPQIFGLVACCVFFFAGCRGGEENAVLILPPEELYGRLFYDVQSKGIFPDSKTFVDCIPLRPPEAIVKEYAKIRDTSAVSIAAFVRKRFEIPEYRGSPCLSDTLPIKKHISRLWDILERPPDIRRSGTLLPLSRPYVVPGGRFREIYYWDSYFTMLGLQEDGLSGLIRHMIGNFSDMITRYGFIPNGNRTYYLTRSQPPFYPVMVSLLAEIEGQSVLVSHRRLMEREYEFWMDGVEKLAGSGDGYRRVVRLPGGEIMNRYWDDKDMPRSESYREDVKTAKDAPERMRKCEIYRNLRAAAESGWDFSSRWLVHDSGNQFRLYTIRTVDIVPVDLNSLLCNMERTIAQACRLAGNIVDAELFTGKFERRKSALRKYCWSETDGFYMDYDAKTGERTTVVSVAGVYPLFFGLADKDQAAKTAMTIEKRLLQPGGVSATANATGQQWDAPNGWAPLQWITISGLSNYGLNALADTIRCRWCGLNEKVYGESYRMPEKFNVHDLSKEGGGGEYPNQDGFGWTNGVYLKLCEDRS